MSENVKTNKIKNIIIDVIMYVFLALCAFFVALLVFGQKDIDGTTQVFGHQLRVVTSDSMDACEATDVSMYEIKSIPIKSMVFVELVPEDEEEANAWYNNIKEGDVLTFRYVYTTQVTITHRVEKKIENLDGTFTFHLVGDNKESDEELLTQVITTGDPTSTNYIIGKVVGQSKLLGNIVTTLRNPIGMVLIIILPSLAIIIYEILRIVSVISSEKKKQIKEEYDKKENEIELLKQRLAELEKKQNNNSNNDSASNNSLDNNSYNEDENKQAQNDSELVQSDFKDEDANKELNNSEDDQTQNDSENLIQSDLKDKDVNKELNNSGESHEDEKNTKSTSIKTSEKKSSPNSTNKKELLQWKKEIEKREQSGLTVDEWCKAKNISKATYYKRLKKVKEEFED